MPTRSHSSHTLTDCFDNPVYQDLGTTLSTGSSALHGKGRNLNKLNIVVGLQTDRMTMVVERTTLELVSFF